MTRTDLLRKAEALVDILKTHEFDLLKLSIEDGGDHQAACDFRIGFRYGERRGFLKGFTAALDLVAEMAPKFDEPLKQGFDHPCRETCAGWAQGKERGEHEGWRELQRRIRE